MKIRFLSSNEFKIRETKKLFENTEIELFPLNVKIEELQTNDEKKLVQDKLLKAFKKIGKPIFVEHTGLHLTALNSMPGGLTQVFWDSLGHDNFAKFYGNLPETEAVAKTLIGYCDGVNLFFFEGEVAGKICDKPRGDTAFQWDCIFVPDGYSQTFAELGEVKNEISMRKIAIEKFIKYLQHGGANC